MIKFIAPVIFLIVSAGIVYWYVVPQYGQIQSLQSEISQYSDASTQAASAIAKQTTLSAEYASISTADLSRLTEFLPDSADDIGAARNISDIAAEYNVGLQGITVTDSGEQSAGSGGPGGSAPSPYGTITVAFSAAMPYQTFLQFLQSIESSLHFTDISTIQFTAGSAEPYTYSLTLSNYWLN